MSETEGERTLSLVEEAATVEEFSCLENVPDFLPMEWVLIELGGNKHLVAMGTDHAQNRMKGFLFSVTEDMNLLSEKGADLCINGKDAEGKDILFDEKTRREVLLSFIFTSLKKPTVLAASFHPAKLGPNWTNTYVQVQPQG